jgi:hypothetical protein
MVRVSARLSWLFYWAGLDGDAEGQRGKETMGEVAEVTETPTTDDAAYAASFAEGFTGQPTESPVAEDPKPEQVDKAEVTPEPKYVQLTEEKYNQIEKVLGMVTKLDQGFGTLGQIQQTLKQMQAAEKAGFDMDAITEEDFAELKAEFPELASMLTKGMNRGAKKFKVPASQAPSVDDTDLADRVSLKLAAKLLEDDFPDWRAIVGPAGSETPFRKWVSTLHEVDQKKIWGSRNPLYLAQQLTKFTEATAAPAKVTNAAGSAPPTKPPAPDRTARLKAAVPVKGVAPATTPADEGGFSSGFAEEFKAMGLKS